MNDFIEAMRANFDSQNEPKVGIFWYHRAKRVLFGVRSIEASELSFNAKGLKTIKILHRTVWQKERAKKSPLFSGPDYTAVPRGRIFEIENEGFFLMVGSWIKDFDQEHIVKLVKSEFDLVELKVKTDSHWDIGQGWSE